MRKNKGYSFLSKAKNPPKKITRSSRYRIFPKFMVKLLIAFVLLGLLAKILHDIKYHW